MTASREAIRQMVIGYLAGQQSGLMTANDVVDQLTDAFHFHREQLADATARYEELLNLATAKMLARVRELEGAYARVRAELEEARRELAARRAIDDLVASERDPTKPLN